MGRVVTSFICVEEGDVSRGEIHEQLGEDTKEFFDATLAGS
jgi:hypothetical protein